MKRTVIATAAALSLTACGGGALTADEARGALPQSSQARVGAPDASAQGVAAAAGTAALTAAGSFTTAPFASAAIDLASAVNTGIVWTLGVVKAVSELPPTSCTGDTCTWGPGSGPLEVNVWMLHVTKESDHYAWSLSGSPKSDPATGFVTVVSGHAWPDGRPRVGHGDLALDLDASARLDRRTTDPRPQTGRIEAAYDNRTSPALDVKFLGTVDENEPSQRVNTAYRYAEDAAGGDLQVASRNLSTDAVFTFHARWNATGAGRGDATFAGSSTATESQCWGSSATLFDLVYRTSTPAQGSDTGAESACAFAPAAPATLAAP